MTPTLDELLEIARAYVPSEAQKRAAIISFAYGNVHLSNPAITREMVEAEYDKLHPTDV